MLVSVLVATTAFALCAAQGSQEVFPYRAFLDCTVTLDCNPDETLKIRDILVLFPEDTLNEYLANSSRVYGLQLRAAEEEAWKADIAKICEDEAEFRKKKSIPFEELGNYLTERCMPPKPQYHDLCVKMETIVNKFMELRTESTARGLCKDEDTLQESIPNMG